ncbi:acyl-CoA thioesterase II [Nocardia sp. BMG51109]|uniref:acyl-CoA thioesterase n=1 Tax=Nocardia sp. BMG51109 TaxID=1056816 RepID=UPI0004657802|nr:thioesterase family protein [Nocardia sp. BMG51109]
MTATVSHPFDQAVHLTPEPDGTFGGQTSQDYANMVGPFGGVTAATLLRAVSRHPQRLGEPLSLTVNYASPIGDGPFVITADPAQTNRSTQHWIVTMTQDGVVKTTATAVFGTRRDTFAATEIAPPRAPEARTIAPQETPEFIPWMRNYEMRFTAGSFDVAPSGPANDSTTTLWVRDAPPRSLDHFSLTAISDVFVPRIMLRLGRVVPAGTVSLSIYFHADAATVVEQGDEPVLATARSQHFGAGFADQAAQLWTGAGTLLATSHQLVYFKA